MEDSVWDILLTTFRIDFPVLELRSRAPMRVHVSSGFRVSEVDWTLQVPSEVANAFLSSKHSR